MRFVSIFLVLCLLAGVFIFTNHDAFSLSYVGDQIAVAYDYTKDDYVVINKVSIPVSQYLSDNSEKIGSFNDIIQDDLFAVEDFALTLRDLGVGFYDLIFSVDEFIESKNDLSSAYLYANDRAYYLFIRSYLQDFNRTYTRADFNFFQKFIYPGYNKMLSDLKHSLTSDISYDRYGIVVDISKTDILLLPSDYFLSLGFNPVVHMSYQDDFYKYGISHLHIDTTFLIQGRYPIYKYYMIRSLVDGEIISELINTERVPYDYDPITRTVIERS